MKILKISLRGFVNLIPGFPSARYLWTPSDRKPSPTCSRRSSRFPLQTDNFQTCIKKLHRFNTRKKIEASLTFWYVRHGLVDWDYITCPSRVWIRSKMILHLQRIAPEWWSYNCSVPKSPQRRSLLEGNNFSWNRFNNPVIWQRYH